jgi:hypothetical protein
MTQVIMRKLALCEIRSLRHDLFRLGSRAVLRGERLMKTRRKTVGRSLASITLLAAATGLFIASAQAQGTQQNPPQNEQGGYTCSSKARAPATS